MSSKKTKLVLFSSSKHAVFRVYLLPDDRASVSVLPLGQDVHHSRRGDGSGLGSHHELVGGEGPNRHALLLARVAVDDGPAMAVASGHGGGRAVARLVRRVGVASGRRPPGRAGSVVGPVELSRLSYSRRRGGCWGRGWRGGSLHLRVQAVPTSDKYCSSEVNYNCFILT